MRKLCGALETDRLRVSLEVTRVPDADILYTIPDLVLNKPLVTNSTLSPMMISVLLMSRTIGWLWG